MRARLTRRPPMKQARKLPLMTARHNKNLELIMQWPSLMPDLYLSETGFDLRMCDLKIRVFRGMNDHHKIEEFHAGRRYSPARRWTSSRRAAAAAPVACAGSPEVAPPQQGQGCPVLQRLPRAGSVNSCIGCIASAVARACGPVQTCPVLQLTDAYQTLSWGLLHVHGCSFLYANAAPDH